MEDAVVNPQDESTTSAPGDRWTWWHYLFVQVLTFELEKAANVTGEQLVGKLPLRLDVVLELLSLDALSRRALSDMPVLASLMRKHTLIEFKGPTDRLECGDLSHFHSTALLWYATRIRDVSREDVVLLLVAPYLGPSLREELDFLGYKALALEKGIHRLEGPTFRTYVLETDELADRDSVLALFSRVLLNDRWRIIQRLKTAENEGLFYFMLQNIQQFAERGDLAMVSTTDQEQLRRLTEELRAAALKSIPLEDWVRSVPLEDRIRSVPVEDRIRSVPVEDRIRSVPVEDRIRSVPVEDRIRSVPVEDRIRSVPVEDRIRGLTDDELKRLRELISRQLPDVKEVDSRGN